MRLRKPKKTSDGSARYQLEEEGLVWKVSGTLVTMGGGGVRQGETHKVGELEVEQCSILVRQM